MADLRVALAQALGPTCRVEREVRPLGACRMFVAVELADGAELLVKVLPGELSLALDLGTFQREVGLLTGRLGHPRLVAPRDAGRAGTLVYHTRRFIDGTTLRAWLARDGELPLRQSVALLRDVLEALAHAHAAGIVHGDLKPENVLVVENGRALVADAGIVGAVGRSLPGGAATAAARTLCGEAYVPPERMDGGVPAGPRDDVYAVGVLVHEMLTGHPPAPEAERLEEVRSVPPWLGELARRCLAAEPAARWSDAAEALSRVARPSAGA